MPHIIPWLHDLYIHYGALGIAIPAFAQELFFPVPVTLTMLSAGFFVFWGTPISAVSLWSLCTDAALPLSIGLTLGAVVNYTIFYFLGKPVIKYLGAFIGITWKNIRETEEKMKSGYSDEVAFFLMRALPVIPSVLVSAFAGAIRWRFWAYTFLTFTGTLVASYALGFVGWQVGKVYIFYAREIGRFELYLFIVLIIGALGWFGYRKFAKN